jgi:hypothetical protein
MKDPKFIITLFCLIVLALGIGKRLDRLEKRIDRGINQIKYDASDEYWKVHDTNNNLTLVKITEQDKANLNQWNKNYELSMKRAKR